MTANYLDKSDRIEVDGVDIQVNPEAPALESTSAGEDIPLLEAATPQDYASASTTSTATTNSSAETAFKRAGEQTTRFIQSLPVYAQDFINQYKPLLVTIGWVFLALLGLRLLSALVDTINSIPLMELLLELIGLGYVLWFAYRYLLTVESRRELSEKIGNIKRQVLGQQDLS